MNRLVKILIIILAALVIAGAGFWVGTITGLRRMPVSGAIPAFSGTPMKGESDGSGTTPYGSHRPDWGRQNESDHNQSENSRRTPDDETYGNRQWQRPLANSGFRRMPGQMPLGTMMGRNHDVFGGRNSMSIGSMFMGGGMMLFGLLFPLGFAILMVLGIIVLFRMVRSQNTVPVEATAVCANCGVPIQNGWKHCPQCGHEI